ncbi:MAG: dynamin family protein [Betaproteobacteria bacterium]|nr:dynamin family protein [Betaproteobacteria bacterium]
MTAVVNQLENLVTRYREWREELRSGIEAYHVWLDSHGHVDIQRSLRLYDLAESLRNDRMVLAFLAEYSRGKSELINAMFFSSFKQRLLPSSVGRTTMCPTELYHDAAEEPYIRLLPIETRARNESIISLKHRPVEWVKIRLDLQDREGMVKAFGMLAQTKSFSLEEANNLGLLSDGDLYTTTVIKKRMSRVDIPAWRHALVNFPHPLLQSGLVILDTPGLNALGTEPELTVSMIPNCHAVLFLLATETGVTKSDLDVWQRYVQGRVPRSLVVLNKIDLLWDDLKTEAEIEADLQRQIQETARVLNVPLAHVFALSAQKGLVARVKEDPVLLERSRIRELERILAEEIVPAKQEILRSAVQREIGSLVDGSLEGVRAALGSTVTELKELEQLSGKNRELARVMLTRLEGEKQAYQENVDAFKNNYGAVLRQGHQLLGTLADDELDRVFSENHRTIEGSWTTAGLMRSMRALFDQFGGYSNSMLDFANATTDFVDNVYREFHEKHGFPKLDPPQLNLQKHVVRMGQLKQATEHFCSDPVNVAFPKFLVIRNFYEQVVTEARGVFRQVRADFESWLGNSLVPLSTQLKEHQKLLERRVENIRKVSGDLSSIKERCEVLEVQRRDLQGQVTELAKIRAVLRGIPETDMGLRNPHAA